MFRFYALQSNFYGVFKKHETMLFDLEDLSIEQMNHMIYSFNTSDLFESAHHYFEDEIICVQNEMYIQNIVQNQCSRLRVYENYIELDIDGNLFFELLKRKYRWYILVKV